MKQFNGLFLFKNFIFISQATKNEVLWKLWLKFVHAAQEYRIRAFWNATNNYHNTLDHWSRRCSKLDILITPHVHFNYDGLITKVNLR